jgi:CubicO group peptidase (beta-lactamase class C family)
VPVALALTVLAGCAVDPTPGPPSDAELAAGIEEFLAGSRTGRYDQVRAVVVEVGGERRYVRGDTTTRGDTLSLTRSVTATLVGIAIGEGRIRGVDQTLGELLPSYASVMPAPLSEATLRQLLTMTAGTVSDQSLEERPPGPDEDWVEYALTFGPQREPGRQFAESGSGSHLLSAVLAEATGMSTLDYAQETLFRSLGIGAGSPAGPPWRTDPQGRQLGGEGLALSADEMVALGRLYLAGGRWQDEQVVPAEWVAEATREQVRTNLPLPWYGYQWWVTQVDGHPAYVAGGFGGQMITVVPDLDLVFAVRTDVGRLIPAPADAYVELVHTVVAPAVA